MYDYFVVYIKLRRFMMFSFIDVYRDTIDRELWINTLISGYENKGNIWYIIMWSYNDECL